MTWGMDVTMTEAWKARRGQIYPRDSPEVTTLYSIIPATYLGRLLKAARIIAVIFQRSPRLLPWFHCSY